MADIDPELLRELNLNLRDLSRDLGQLGNDRIVAALGQLGVRLDRRRRTEEQETQAVKKFVQQVDIATRAVQGQSQTAQDAAQSQQQLNNAQREINRLMRQEADQRGSLLTDQQRNRRELREVAQGRLQSDLQYLRSLSTVRGALSAMAGSSGLSNRAFRNLNVALIAGSGAMSGLQKVLGSLGNSLASLASAGFNTAASLAKGETSVTVFNSMIDAGARALADIGKSIPLFGAAVSAVAGVSKFLLEMLQMVTDSMNNVAQVGGLAASGMDGFVESADQAGLSLKQMEKITLKNANIMSRFGGTVGNGLQRFSKITGDVIRTDLGRELRFLGFNREQIADATAGFLNQQIRLGSIRSKTDAQLTAGAAKYAKELDLLAKLTGQSREEVEKQQDAALSESRFRAALDGMDETTRKRFLDFQSVLNKAAPEMAAGFRDITSGFPTTAAAQEFLRLGGQQIVESIRSGMGKADAFQQLQGLIEPQIEGARSIALAVGDEVRVLGKYTELRDVLNARIIDGDVQLNEQQQHQIDSAGDLTRSIVAATEVMDALQREMQSLAVNMVPYAANMVTTFADTLMWGTNRILEILGMKGGEGSIWKIVGTVAGGIIGKMIGSLLGGLLGAITGFLIGGPLGAAAGAIAGSTAGGGIAAIIGALAGYNVGSVGDKVGPLEALGRFGSGVLQSLRPEFMNTPRPAPTELQDRARQSVDQPGGGRDIYQGMRSDQRPTSTTETPPNLANVKPENLFDFRGGLTGRQENFDNLEPAFRDRLTQMAFEYRKATGKRLPISSGARTQEENAAVGGVGTSRHLQGLAVDLSADSVNELKRLGMLDKHGFKQNNRSAWHISDDGFAMGGISRGPKHGYRALLHGIEAVVPLPDGKSIPVDLRMPEIQNPFDDIDYRLVSNEMTGIVEKMSMNLQNTVEDIVRRMASNPALESALQELVSLQRSNNSTQERLLQVSAN